ncbi:uncharacterized protein BXZ73DRAFT_89257 [Epithele typhae]|uniref:uncharacterized protein n=1 Tax=Epithele typhae TaxID=378194 RepID=UPI0020078319|nr:uncharacterized protein BXZ73DRAFT_89257 [Epithele typhae]KAH9937841.1 hypothetical protein BXZ73DRAFT_89257 [Epithele typhae]
MAKSVLDFFKPMRGEAIARLRTNSIGLVSLSILAHLLPVPTPWRAFDTVWKQRPASAPYYYTCAAELLVFGLLALNVLQALFALKYPRAPLPPPPSAPATPVKSPLQSTPARQWRLQSSTPNASPQRQKAFSTYVPSPLHHPPSASSQAEVSFTSSVSSVPGSPASPLAAYRGRHQPSVGRAFDGSLLSRLAREDSDDEDS